jgi:23S rRNA pseudouridine2605 synthase
MNKTDYRKNITFPLRLNKYISYSGICSRRKADEMILEGLVSVNGKIIKEPGFMVEESKTVVKVSGKAIYLEQNFVYLVLNKPKDCITTTKDERERKTVMDFLPKTSFPRVYPVGRLDRNTTGVLLFTNDGELSHFLTHPSHNIQKEYVAKLGSKMSEVDFQMLFTGILIDSELYKVQDAYFIDDQVNQVSITINYGKYHIVRKMFETLGYEIIHLDRVNFAGITKYGLLKSKWRFLNGKEIYLLKQMMKKKNTKR